MLNHAVTASDRVWPSRPNYSRENKRGLRSGCVSGCAGMEVFLPLHTHTHTLQGRGVWRKRVHLWLFQSPKPKIPGRFPPPWNFLAVIQTLFPPLQVELSHKKSLTPQGDKSTTRGSQPKTRPSDKLSVQTALNPSYPRDVSLPHHGGALGTACPR